MRSRTGYQCVQQLPGSAVQPAKVLPGYAKQLPAVSGVRALLVALRPTLTNPYWLTMLTWALSGTAMALGAKMPGRAWHVPPLVPAATQRAPVPAGVRAPEVARSHPRRACVSVPVVISTSLPSGVTLTSVGL